MEMEKLHSSAGECIDLEYLRKQEYSGDFHCRGILGINDHGKVEFSLKKIYLMWIDGISDSGYGLASSCPAGYQTGKKVLFIGVGDRDKEIAILDTRIQKALVTYTVSDDAHGIIMIGYRCYGFAVFIDKRNIMIFAGKQLGDNHSYLAASYNDYIHKTSVAYMPPFL